MSRDIIDIPAHLVFIDIIAIIAQITADKTIGIGIGTDTGVKFLDTSPLMSYINISQGVLYA
tara:strand:+ start:144 stop:329 length:186 start_codon:yes stop_codon:yes gene_type:complete